MPSALLSRLRFIALPVAAWLALPTLAGLLVAIMLGPQAGAAVSAALLTVGVPLLWLALRPRLSDRPESEGSRTAGDVLASQLHRQRDELRVLTRRLMTVQEDERTSLSRELHDDIGQAITAIKLCASSLQHEPDPPRTAVVQETAQEIADIADQTVAKLRDLSLLLRPPQLDALGLEAALRWQAGAMFRAESPRLTLDITRLDRRPHHAIELACFRIAQEALTNVLRHARARHVLLRLECDDDELRLHVGDDGRGLPPGHATGLGLITMRERAEQLGGTLSITSQPGNTRVDVRLPLQTLPDAPH